MSQITFRPFAGDTDYPAFAAVHNASNQADAIEETTDVEEVGHWMQPSDYFDPMHDLLVAEVGGDVVGWTRVQYRLRGPVLRVYSQSGFVLPAWHHKGIGTKFLAFTEARARQVAPRFAPDEPRQLQIVAEDTAFGKQALAAQAGYQPVRYFCFMQRPELETLPEMPLPVGFEFRPAEAAHYRAIWEAKNESFKDHWESTQLTENDYARWVQEIKSPHLWRVIWAGDEVVGVSLNDISLEDNAHYNFKRGWINTLGVRRAWRGRGLAKSLLADSMRALRAAGMTEAVLGVDAENPTGALQLYSGLGFKVINKDAVMRKSF